ncbi:MAG: helicase-related protein [Planctomycetota bacterium]
MTINRAFFKTNRIFGRTRMRRLVEDVFAKQRSLKHETDSNLRQRSDELREQLVADANDDGVNLTTAFSLVRESTRRTIGMEHYGVQLEAGVVLSQGAVAEMQTGEGKTLTSTLPAFVSALRGSGVHVATVNAYLAKRDFQQLQPVFELLGCSVGLVESSQSVADKQSAYRKDVTFSTGYEVGFDWMRDQLANSYHASQTVVTSAFRRRLHRDREKSVTMQRGLNSVLIDEVDSVLLDEATTPLVISQSGVALGDSKQIYQKAKTIADHLQEGSDYRIIDSKKCVQWSDHGQQVIRDSLAGILVEFRRPWESYVRQALHAQQFYKRNESYVVVDDQIKIVDEFTGRIFDDRTWRDGLHQAIEAKENVTITDENQSVAKISRQCFFRMYGELAGMTGTATGNENEFHKFYSLPVFPISARKQCQRVVLRTRYFADNTAKSEAIVKDILKRHRQRQPILVGTRTIAESQHLTELLRQHDISAVLLNGLQDQSEAELVEKAGGESAITIATNMAGRGTDIKPSEKGLNAGGLHVIATERHFSARIDRQLAGRAARQGQPGSCQFFVSADDKLLGGRWLSNRIRKFCHRNQGDTSSYLDRGVQRLQKQCEYDAFALRKAMLDRELWLNDFRKLVA